MNADKVVMSTSKLFYHLDEIQKWKRNEYFPPIMIEVNPTDLCNQKCFFCYTEYLGHKNLSIPDAALIRIFRELGMAGVKACQIQGTGEPFVNKGLPDAIVAGNENGLDCATHTNGTLVTNEILEKIIPNLCFFRVTNMECNEKLYQKTHGRRVF